MAEHEQLETKLYQDRVAAGDFDVAIEFQADFMDDPTAQFSKFLTKKLSPSGYSGHTDTKIDDMYEKQRRTIDVAERTKIVREMERYALTQAYNVPLLWWQRIIVNHKKIQGWYMTPSHYLWQDLTDGLARSRLGTPLTDFSGSSSLRPIWAPPGPPGVSSSGR